MARFSKLPLASVTSGTSISLIIIRHGEDLQVGLQTWQD